MDPAGPLYSPRSSKHKISSASGKIVEVIHSDKLLGMHQTVGGIDFWINGGSNQPGCILSKGIICDHNRAYECYAEALDKPGSFTGIRCNSYDDFLERKCSSDTAYIGSPYTEGYKEGNYYLKTSSSPPYGLGQSGTRP